MPIEFSKVHSSSQTGRGAENRAESCQVIPYPHAANIGRPQEHEDSPSLEELGAFGQEDKIDSQPSQADAPAIVSLRLEAIILPDDRRSLLNPEAVETLAQSIARTGLQHPIRVAQDAESRKYAIIAGNHRFAAHESLGLHRVNAIIVEGDPIELDLDQIEENLARRHFTILERALLETTVPATVTHTAKSRA